MGGRCDNFSRYLFKEPQAVPTTPAESKPRPVSPVPSMETNVLASAKSATAVAEKG